MFAEDFAGVAARMRGAVYLAGLAVGLGITVSALLLRRGCSGAVGTDHTLKGCHRLGFRVPDRPTGYVRGMAPSVDPIHARELGPRGSRREVASADPAAELTPTAAAVIAAIPAWWSARAAQYGLSGKWLDVAEAIDSLPPAPIPVLPPLEETWGPLTAEEVGQAYVSALLPETRARHGRHYTPRHLADQLWGMTRTALGYGRSPQALGGLVRDPACGAGALLLPALREHLHASHDVDPRLVLAALPSLIEGVDADPAAVWVANVVMAAELLPLLAKVPEARRRLLPALAHVGDGLAPRDVPALAVVMNPPYGRVRLNDTDRARFSSVLYGHANLYGLFMAAAEEQLDKDGVVGALVPTSFTAGRYFAPLRDRLSSRVRLQSVTFVEERSGVFTSVLQETCLAVFGRKRTRRTTVASVGESRTEIATVDTPLGAKPWLVPRRSDLAAIAVAARAMPLTLRGAGWSASTGPLVWNRRKEDLAPTGGVPIIWGSDLVDGEVRPTELRKSLRSIRLHSDSDRRTMILKEPAVLVQRTTAPEQQRRLVAADLNAATLAAWGGEVVVENHVNILRPVDSQLVSQRLLYELLAMKTLDAVARCISGSVALSAFELESIPLPAAEVLAEWESLNGRDLERAVSDTYRGVSR